MKIKLILLVTLFCSACDNSVNISNNEPLIYPSEDLIGKTVSEYEELVKAEDKTSNSSASTSELKPKDTDVGTGKSEVTIDNNTGTINKGFLELTWEGLIAPGYDAEAILAKYEPMINTMKEGSDEALKLYEKMEAEFGEAPPNQSLANKKVSIPGFIAPLEQSNGVISEFLLVPYFGACIHMPAPPSNQTVHVKVASNSKISAEDAYDPIWVSGELIIDKSSTDIGSASYQIHNATISKYE